jgi:hypothetical protein
MKADEPGGEFVTNGKEETAQNILVLKTQEKKPLGGPRCRWEYIFKLIQIYRKCDNGLK